MNKIIEAENLLKKLYLEDEIEREFTEYQVVTIKIDINI